MLRMRHILLVTTCLVLLSTASSKPQQQAAPKFTRLNQEQIKHLQQSGGFGPSPFKARVAVEEEEEEEPFEDNHEADSVVSATQVRRPSYAEENYPVQNSIPIIQARPQLRPQPQPQQQQQQQHYRRPPGPPQSFRQQIAEESKSKSKEEEEEKEEPDRLSLLLPQSKFDCAGKMTGYYADEDLNCEVFHYCQDNGKHSWICPEGFSFHQVHLICMPPSGDNICDRSSQFHFINEYLYKPLNLEEHQNKPNITLRYSERFYPNQYYNNRPYDDDEEESTQPQRRGPVRLQQAPAPQAPVLSVIRRPQSQQQPVPFSATFRPEATVGQVFRSPEEVNISLQQRRPPQQYITPRYQRQEEDY